MSDPWKDILDVNWAPPETPGVKQHSWRPGQCGLVCDECGFETKCMNPKTVLLVEAAIHSVRGEVRRMGRQPRRDMVLDEDCDKTRENIARSVLES